VDVAETITQCRVMPDAAYEPLWDSIVVPPVVKDRLLRSALLALSLRPKLTFEVTALHGLAVLFGPPGTGKTTLARGLAGQLAPLTSGKQTRFIEVNPHGLMSAEHGQSQRKVAELLGEHIPRLGEDGMPTVVLLDEVESMAVARSEASLAANPADVHRATDAVLTALDANAVSMPQLFIVATSNFTRALDAAFLSGRRCHRGSCTRQRRCSRNPAKDTDGNGPGLPAVGGPRQRHRPQTRGYEARWH
jgi:pachytene checkpoint protein 2